MAENLPWAELLQTPYVVTRRVRRRWRTDRILGPGTVFEEIGEPVLSTGGFIAAMEEVTFEAVSHLLPSHLALLGRSGMYEHLGPAVAGDQLHVRVACTGGSGKRTYWRSDAHNVTTDRYVGWLAHTAVATDRARFRERLYVG